MKRQKVAIGIDPGVKTGFAVKNLSTKEFLEVKTVKAYQIPELVLKYGEDFEIYVVFEDARKRTWYGNYERTLFNKFMSGVRMSTKEKNAYKGILQGSGDVRGQSRSIEQFLEDYKIPYIAKKPTAKTTKVSVEYFNRLTRWSKRSSEHSRDAGMLIQGFTLVNLKLHFKKVA